MSDCAVCGVQISSAAEKNEQLFCDLHAELARAEAHAIAALKHCRDPNLATKLDWFVTACAEELGDES